MIAPARRAAYEVLLAVDAGRADLPSALARARTSLPDERDRALAGEIATGTLRWQGAFDHVIAAFTKKPIHKLDPEVRQVLRLTMFQLLHLDRVPASAAVNDAVNITRKAGKKSAGPLVNAVLRRVSRERDRLPLPARPTTDDREAQLDYLSIALSHPRWLVSRWLTRYGFEATETWCRFNNGPAALTVRANTLKNAREALADRLREHAVITRPARFAPDGLVVERGNPLATPLADEGVFLVQDEASQLVPLMTAVTAGLHVLDACASPGGKTTAMASLMKDHGLLVAADVRGRRIDLLKETVRASGTRIVRVIQADAARPLPFGPVFDCVLVDAPCSGLGTLRRDPDIRWRRNEGHFEALAALQMQILESVSQVLKPGGRLVYATCSSEPEENEEVVARFLKLHSGFSVEFPGWLPPNLGQLVTPQGFLRTLPFSDGLEAFFASALVKAANVR